MEMSTNIRLITPAKKMKKNEYFQNICSALLVKHA